MSTDGTFEKIMKYRNLGVQVFRESDYKEKGNYMTRLIKSKQIGKYDIAFPIDIDEFVVHFDKTNNVINPGHTKKYINNYLKTDFHKHEVFKCAYIETIITTLDPTGYDNALVETEYGRYNNYGNLAKSFFNKYKWNGVLDHGNHYNTDKFKLSDLCLIHYHCRSLEQMKKKIINNVKGLGYTVDLNELKDVLAKNKDAHGSHHIINMIKILENNYDIGLTDVNLVTKKDVSLQPLINHFAKLSCYKPKN